MTVDVKNLEYRELVELQAAVERELRVRPSVNPESATYRELYSMWETLLKESHEVHRVNVEIPVCFNFDVSSPWYAYSLPELDLNIQYDRDDIDCLIESMPQVEAESKCLEKLLDKVNKLIEKVADECACGVPVVVQYLIEQHKKKVGTDAEADD